MNEKEMNRNGKVRVQSFLDLIVWQRGVPLAAAIYRIASDFPRKELYGLTARPRRSAVSIPSNIAEGQED